MSAEGLEPSKGMTSEMGLSLLENAKAELFILIVEYIYKIFLLISTSFPLKKKKPRGLFFSYLSD